MTLRLLTRQVNAPSSRALAWQLAVQHNPAALLTDERD